MISETATNRSHAGTIGQYRSYVWVGSFLNLAGGDLHHLDGGSNHVGGSLLAFGASGH